MPGLKRLALEAAKGQSAVGSWGQRNVVSIHRRTVHWVNIFRHPLHHGFREGVGGGWFGLKSFESERLVFMGMEKMVVHVLGLLFFIKRLVPVHGCWPSGVFSIHGGKSVYILTVGCLNWVSTKVTTISRRRSVAFQLTDWPLTHSPVAL